MGDVRKTSSLMDRDVCRNGHDITDKGKMIYTRVIKQTGKMTHSCRACNAVSSASHRGVEYQGKYNRLKLPVTLSENLRNKIAERIKMASEDNLLEVMLLLNKLVPNTEEEN